MQAWGWDCVGDAMKTEKMPCCCHQGGVVTEGESGDYVEEYFGWELIDGELVEGY